MGDDRIEDLVHALVDHVDGQDPGRLLEILADPYARHTLRCLFDRPQASLDELAELNAGLEAMSRETLVLPATYQRIRVHLHHVTLPKLQDERYLQYDATEHTISRVDPPSHVREILEALEAHGIT